MIAKPVLGPAPRTDAAMSGRGWEALLTLRTRDVRGISLGMCGAFTLGVALWLAYGLALGQWPIVVANAVTLALSATILAVKVLEDRKRRPAPPA